MPSVCFTHMRTSPASVVLTAPDGSQTTVTLTKSRAESLRKFVVGLAGQAGQRSCFELTETQFARLLEEIDKPLSR